MAKKIDITQYAEKHFYKLVGYGNKPTKEVFEFKGRLVTDGHTMFGEIKDFAEDTDVYFEIEI